MIDEVWQNIPGFEGLYQVSNLGRIKSLSRKIRQKNRVISWPERILKRGKAKGYIHYKLYDGTKHYHVTGHILVTRTFLPIIQIKRLSKEKIHSYRELSLIFNVTISTISMIVSNRVWKQI